jgi:GT2 family glycosyltransferase
VIGGQPRQRDESGGHGVVDHLAVDVSVVVVSYNGRTWLARCLSALARQEGVRAETILVDNGSSDDSVDFVQRAFPKVRVVALHRNAGFAEANNLGVRASRGRFVALLNNDTEPSDGWLRSLKQTLESNPWASLAASCIVYMHDTSIIDSVGDGLTRWGGAFKHLHGRPVTEAPAAREVFGVCGAACLMSRAVFEDVGGFDEDFFAVHEDVDFSYRAQLLGYRCIYVPEAVVAHAGSGTLGHRSHQAVFFGQRNLEWVYLKNTPLGLLVATLPAHVVYNVAAAAYFAATGRLGPFLRGKLAAFGGLRGSIRKRRSIQRRRRTPLRRLWQLMDRRWVAIKWSEKRFEVTRLRLKPTSRAPATRGAEASLLGRAAAAAAPSDGEPAMRGAVSVVIVNYNSGRHLARCLQSLKDHLPENAWDCCVVDNASSDGSERVASQFGSRVRLQRNDRNAGFARAANQGIAATSGELVLILNPDCGLMAEAICVLTGELQLHPTCALVGPRVLNPDGSIQASARGDPTMVTGLFGRSTLLTRVFPASRAARNNLRVHLPPEPGTRSVEVDWVSGACMLARRDALQAVGGFDERYFLYWEDADLCRRLRMDGYSVRYVPDARVMHEGGGSSNPSPSVAVRAFHQSAYTYYVTHVASGRWHPQRWLAWLILRLRCSIKLLRARWSVVGGR